MIAVTLEPKECNALSQTLTKEKFPQDKLHQQSQMANRKVLISGLYGDERRGISTLNKIPLCRLWEKLRHNQGRVPGLVEQIWVIYWDKNSHHGKLQVRKQLLSHMPLEDVRFSCRAPDTWDVHCIKMVPPEQHSGDPHHREDEKSHRDAAGTHMLVTINFCSISRSLSFSVSCIVK